VMWVGSAICVTAFGVAIKIIEEIL
jgi:hypothetical protein